MPHTKELLKQGKLKQVKSSLPPNSAVSWSSIMTARNPGEHAIFGFTDFIPGSYTVSYHHSMRLKAQPFWQRNNDKRAIIINLPATYPPQALNGVHVSGFVSPQLEKAVYSNEELYEGPYLGDAPDLIVLPERDFSFKTNLFADDLFSVDRLQGKHTEDDAFLYLNNDSDEFREASRTPYWC